MCCGIGTAVGFLTAADERLLTVFR